MKNLYEFIPNSDEGKFFSLLLIIAGIALLFLIVFAYDNRFEDQPFDYSILSQIECSEGTSLHFYEGMSSRTLECKIDHNRVQLEKVKNTGN